MSARNTKRYVPTEFALVHIRPGEYRAQIRKVNGEDWVFLYSGRKRVWDCNPTFFREWFKEAK